MTAISGIIGWIFVIIFCFPRQFSWVGGLPLVLGTVMYSELATFFHGLIVIREVDETYLKYNLLYSILTLSTAIAIILILNYIPVPLTDKYFLISWIGFYLIFHYSVGRKVSRSARSAYEDWKKMRDDPYEITKW